MFELSSYNFTLYRNRNKKDELVSSKSHKVFSYGLDHGDIIYLIPNEGSQLWMIDDDSAPSASQSFPNGK